MKQKISILIAAGGSSERFLGGNKLLAVVNEQPIISHTVAAVQSSGLADEIILVVNKEFLREFTNTVDNKCKIIVGGRTRTQSVKNGLLAVTGDITLIHDGARPFVSANLIRRCVKDVKKYGSAISAIKTTDSIAEVDDWEINRILNRAVLYNVQTPQGFMSVDIKNAYKVIGDDDKYQDDSSVFMANGGIPHIIEGEEYNIKITTREDLRHFDSIRSFEKTNAQNNTNVLIGSAFDTHRLVVGRKLILGGLHIPFEKGLLGHSDADVLLHAVMGAVLNALGLPDIGRYFPDTDPKYKDADSAELLKKILSVMQVKGYRIGNISFTVIAEQPKLSPYIEKIKQQLSLSLSLPISNIGLSATTAEGLGEIGRGDSIACTGYVLLNPE